jgi:iron complex outermembrane receptor protein
MQIGGIRVEIPRLTATTGGASAVELTLDSMSAPPAPTMEQVLRAMPLIVIRQNSRGQAQPALRGAEDRQIAVLMDGVPLTLGWDHRTDLSIIPLTAAQDIRLLRGLPSVLHGPNVLGGVVEVDVARGARRQSTPIPLVVNLSGEQTGGRALGATGGRLLELDDGQVVIRAGAGYAETPGAVLPGGLEDDPGQRAAFLTDDGDLRLNSDTERYDGFASLRYQGDEGTWFSGSASAFTTERGVPPEAHVDDPRLWRYPEQKRFVGAVSGGTGQRSTAWGEGDLEFSVGVDLAATEIDQYDSAAFDEVVGGEIGDDRTLTLRLLGDHTLGDRADLRTAFTYADVVHDEILDRSELNEYRQRLWSLGVEVERRIDGIPGLSGLRDARLSVGVAADGADTPETGGKPPLGRLWEWGGRVGFSALAGDGNLRVHGGVSRRARFPALRELYSGALGRFEPNPELRPEILLGGEVGFTWSPRGTEVQVVGFHQRLTDGIVRSSVEVDGIRKFKRINQDEVRSTGLEILASTALGPLTFSGDLTLQEVAGFQEDGAEVELEYEPTAVGRLGMSAELPAELVASGELRYMASQLCENPEVGGLESFDTDPAVDLSVRRTFQVGGSGVLSRLETFLGIDNAGDAAVFDQCGLPRPGRTFRLQLRLW